MAVPGQEVELLGEGLQASSTIPGAFALNMVWKNDAWQVREGLGQVKQLTTTMSVNPDDGATGTTDWGYQKHLGSKLITTDFGHEQIVSVFRGFVNVANIRQAAQMLSVYLVRIDDITARTTHEEALYRHTAENSREVVPMPDWHGLYETNLSRDYQEWVVAEDSPIFFEQFNDALFFGSEKMGTYTYRPAVFRERRHKFVDKVRLNTFELGYSESSLVSPAFAAPGIFSEGFAYFDRADFPKPADLTVIGRRLVYASGRRIYFSDIEYPRSIIASNFVDIGSEDDITAIVEHNDNIVAFTRTETWLYTPSVGGALASQGRTTQLSANIGCLSSAAYTTIDNTLVWVDHNGVYQMSQGFAIGDISKEFYPLFNTFVKNPFTSFYVDNGWTSILNQQPNTTLMFRPGGVNVEYSPSEKAVLISIPEERITLCFARGKWSVWATESVVHLNGVPESDLGVQQNVENPWYVASATELYVIGSLDTQSLTDDALFGGDSGTRVDDSTKSSSYYLLQYGRGGGIDRSIEDEDDRLAMGKYRLANTLVAGDESYMFFEKWIRLPRGFTFQTSGTVVGDGEFFYLVPINVVPITSTAAPAVDWQSGVSFMQVDFTFDNSNWEPVFVSGVATEIEGILTNERSKSGSGWGIGGPTGGTKEIQCYDGVTPSRTGNKIQLRFTDATDPMNLSPEVSNPIMYLPFKRKTSSAVTIKNQSSIAFSGFTTNLTDLGRGNTKNMHAMVWEQMVIGTDDIRQQDSVAQPVDWAYKTVPVGLEDESIKKARGLYIRLMSHGAGVAGDYLFEQWVYGLCNTIVGSDNKEYVSQIIDYDGVGAAAEAIQDRLGKNTIRSRIYNTSQALVEKTFNTTGVTFADTDSANKTTGTYLIDDEEVETLATSDSVKGMSFTYMLFGHVQNRAQALYLDSVRATLRPMGGRRRRGK
jgi:hypothetical protein